MKYAMKMILHNRHNTLIIIQISDQLHTRTWIIRVNYTILCNDRLVHRSRENSRRKEIFLHSMLEYIYRVCSFYFIW